MEIIKENLNGTSNCLGKENGQIYLIAESGKRYKALEDATKINLVNLRCPKCDASLDGVNFSYWYYEYIQSNGRMSFKEICINCGHNTDIERTTTTKKRGGHTDSKWRKDVLEAYGNRCRICGSDDDIHAHHLIPDSVCRNTNDAELIHAINNGVPVCEKCHNKIHHGDKRAESDLMLHKMLKKQGYNFMKEQVPICAYAHIITSDGEMSRAIYNNSNFSYYRLKQNSNGEYCKDKIIRREEIFAWKEINSPL